MRGKHILYWLVGAGVMVAGVTVDKGDRSARIIYFQVCFPVLVMPCVNMCGA